MARSHISITFHLAAGLDAQGLKLFASQSSTISFTDSASLLPTYELRFASKYSGDRHNKEPKKRAGDHGLGQSEFLVRLTHALFERGVCEKHGVPSFVLQQ